MSFYAPPPGSRSGVADYAESLHRRLQMLNPPPVPLYHLGNNRLHAGIYERALSEPGVIVLHDAVLHHLFLGTLSRERYIEEFVYNYGEWSRDLAEDLWAGRGGSGTDPRHFRYPMLKRVIARARAVIVHNPGAAEIAEKHGATRIRIIPHLFEPDSLPDSAETAWFRDQNAIPQGAVLFGIFGYLRESKRVVESIRAFHRLRAQNSGAFLLLAGDAVSPDLARLLRNEASTAGIIRLPHLTERDLMTAAAAVDCCLNLRYPGAGETSGIAVRMMGTGKPVILTDNKENSDIPRTACLRVAPGVAESAELFDHMVLVFRFPELAREIGNEARLHVLKHHSPDDAARRYYEVLCAAFSA